MLGKQIKPSKCNTTTDGAKNLFKNVWKWRDPFEINNTIVFNRLLIAT